MRRLVPAALGALHAAVPVFPAFITLTSVAYPGVSLFGRPLVWAVLAIACLIAVYLLLTLLVDRSHVGQPLLWPLGAWVAATMLSTVAGFDPRAGLLFVSIFGLGGIAWHCALVRFFRERYVAPALFWSYLLSGTLAAGSAVAMALARKPAALYAISHGRATGTFILPGELAAYLVVFVPIAYGIARVARTMPLRALAWSSVIVGTIALYETHSRAGWMGFFAAAAFFVAVQVRARRTGALVATAVICAGVVAILAAFNVQHNPSEDYTRIAIWQAAVQIIDRFPLTGVGPFDFSRLYAVVHVPDADATAFHAHSLYLTFFAELGVLGLAAFLYICVVLVRVLCVRLASAPADAALLSVAAAAGLVGVAVQGLVDTMSVVIFGLWMPTMGLAIAAAGGDWDRRS
ncbi:MAG: O-antigen ligase family protein [Candidatus Eremiobacteraeota bacterium]|nr:O-antigen ligase family protein [Candidatus Eremiobacteraeota bacterium]MBV8374095.1 O-antigen ligase family protein [Candidatus Eremiobacteraeota bacterium]